MNGTRLGLLLNLALVLVIALGTDGTVALAKPYPLQPALQEGPWCDLLRKNEARGLDSAKKE
jgi:hypothetical protein